MPKKRPADSVSEKIREFMEEKEKKNTIEGFEELEKDYPRFVLEEGLSLEEENLFRNNKPLIVSEGSKFLDAFRMPEETGDEDADSKNEDIFGFLDETPFSLSFMEPGIPIPPPKKKAKTGGTKKTSGDEPLGDTEQIRRLKDELATKKLYVYSKMKQEEYLKIAKEGACVKDEEFADAYAYLNYAFPHVPNRCILLLNDTPVYRDDIFGRQEFTNMRLDRVPVLGPDGLRYACFYIAGKARPYEIIDGDVHSVEKDDVVWL